MGFKKREDRLAPAMVKKKGKRVVRHRSPMPPPSKVIDKQLYRRSAEKQRLRKDIGEIS